MASDLFTGIAVVIDDEIGKENATINNIIEQITKKCMPCIQYTSLPDDAVIDHLEGISFILLDWRLQANEAALEGVRQPNVLAQAAVTDNIEFLKKVTEKYFVPIFIFTEENKDVVKTALIENNLYFEDKPNYIFLKNKSELTGRSNLSKTIEAWARRTPSIYVLKEWGREYSKAKHLLFHDFYQFGPSWPKILWKNYDADGVDPSSELGEVITRNIHTRMAPYSFDKGIINRRGKSIDNDELRKVLQGERYIEKKRLPANSIAAGDLFKISGKLYINIRPDCDCIPNRNVAGACMDDVQLYLLKGSKLTKAQLSRQYSKDYGHFNENDSQSIVFSIDNGDSFSFQYKDIHIKKWSEVSDKRLGRLLPPYITRIQQRYALYLQRQGVPRTPKEAVFFAAPPVAAAAPANP